MDTRQLLSEKADQLALGYTDHLTNTQLAKVIEHASLSREARQQRDKETFDPLVSNEFRLTVPDPVYIPVRRR